MEWERYSTDLLERNLEESQSTIDRATSIQLEILAELDRRQVATGDGCRNLSEWTAARLDIGLDRARALVRTMRRTESRTHLREGLGAGELTFDRVEALSRIPDEEGLMEHLDISGVRREASKRIEMDARSEYRDGDDRFLVMQPTLDESWWKLWGGLDGPSGAFVDKVLTEAADQLPADPDDDRGSTSWRKATALVELCLTDEPVPAQVTVFVDSDHAGKTNGNSGVTLEAGPKVAKHALEALLCDSITEITVDDGDGRPMEYGRRYRTVPPALRRAMIHRDGNACAADGCDSRYRLEIHHIVPWSEGGTTDPDNLITMCWFHHQIVIHERGFAIERHPDHGRVRFTKREPDRPI